MQMTAESIAESLNQYLRTDPRSFEALMSLRVITWNQDFITNSPIEVLSLAAGGLAHYGIIGVINGLLVDAAMGRDVDQIDEVNVRKRVAATFEEDGRLSGFTVISV